MTLSKITKPITDKDRDNKINGLIDEFDSLAGVAITGSYNDLTNKPTIPDAQVQSNWNETDTSSKAYIKNKPTIPTVNNATLTIQKNGTTVKTFTANASSNVTCNITVPTDTGDLTNNAGYTKNTGTVTSVNGVTPVDGAVSIPIPTVNNATLTIKRNGTTVNTFTSNASTDVTCDITVPTKTSDLSNDEGYGKITGIMMNGESKGTSGYINLGTVITSHQDISGKANTADLATVATSGDYNDLTNKPTIPAGVVVDQTYSSTSANAQSGVAIKNAKFIRNTASQTNSLAVGVSTLQGQYNTAVGNLANAGSSNNNYAVGVGAGANASGSGSVGIGSAALAQGNSSIQIGMGNNQTDYSMMVGFRGNNKNYQLLDGTTGKIPDDRLNTTIARTADLSAVATSGSYNDLSNKPTIPTDTSDLTNGAGYTTNTGTITGITMNGVSKGTSGVVDLGTVITSHQDISGKVNYSDSIQIVDNRGSTSATHFYTYSTIDNALDFLQNEIESLNGGLNNKLNNTTPHIIDTIHTNGAGYRIYSDGWCEQWGTISPVSSNTSNQQVTFYKEFEDTDYTFFGHSHYSASTSASSTNVGANTARSYSVATSENNAKTTKSINILYINNKWETYWFAMGYLKTGEY